MSVTCGSFSYSTRTSDAAKRAISDVSATTSAIGWPLNMILPSYSGRNGEPSGATSSL